jgi:hypothetical protein
MRQWKVAFGLESEESAVFVLLWLDEILYLFLMLVL